MFLSGRQLLCFYMVYPQIKLYCPELSCLNPNRGISTVASPKSIVLCSVNRLFCGEVVGFIGVTLVVMFDIEVF